MKITVFMSPEFCEKIAEKLNKHSIYKQFGKWEARETTLHVDSILSLHNQDRINDVIQGINMAMG